jgi:hypothetical protein
VLPSQAGCADGTREGFTDLALHPDVASCAAAWSTPGILAAGTRNPACGRAAGNDGSNPSGAGCTVADACAAGWHVCDGLADLVKSLGKASCADAADGASGFYVIRQSSTGCSACATGAALGCDAASCAQGCAQSAATTNDVFGCGDLGDVPYGEACGVLDRFSNDLCASLPPVWSCGTNSFDEADHLAKSGPGEGGVICCRG